MVSYSTFKTKQKTYWSDNETCIISMWVLVCFQLSDYQAEADTVILHTNTAWAWYDCQVRRCQNQLIFYSMIYIAWKPWTAMWGGESKWKKNSSWILPEPRFEELVFSLSKKMFSSFQMVSFMNIFLSLLIYSSKQAAQERETNRSPEQNILLVLRISPSMIY